MNMWGLLMIILAVLSAAGILYLASRIGRFWIIKRIAKEKRNICFLIGLIILIALSASIWLAWGYMNASDPLSLNLYTYCANNPVMYVDPSGHIVTEWDKLYCSETELNIIEEATFEWQDASARGDAVGMTTAHEKANAVRKPYLTHYESISDMGYITITLKQLDIDSGVKVVTLNGNQYLDVTMAIYAALYETCESGNVFQNTAVLKYFYFISLVNHDHAWDIKRPERWQETIGSTFPGYNKYALFNGRFFTPEDLGNLTYGYIGAHLGMGSGILRLGSFVAAGAPLGGDALFNESKDSGYVQLGVDLYLNGGIWQ